MSTKGAPLGSLTSFIEDVLKHLIPLGVVITMMAPSKMDTLSVVMASAGCLDTSETNAILAASEIPDLDKKAETTEIVTAST